MAKRQRDENPTLRDENPTTKDENSTTRKESRWNLIMDEVLIDAFLHQHNMGNPVDGTFTTTAYDNIVAKVNAKLNRNFKKDNIKNRWKNIKQIFSKSYDIFKGGLSGFSWNPNTKMWDAEPEVWKKLIEAHPEAEKWMNKPIPYYEKMMILYGKDKATGEHAETLREMRSRQYSASTEDFMGTIDGIDHMVSQHEVTIENLENLSNIFVEVDDDQPEEQPHPPHSASSSKTKKTKLSKVEKEVISIVDAIDRVAGAIQVGNEYFRDAFQRLPMKETEIYDHLIELDIAPEYFSDAYLFLIEHPDKMRAVMGTPFEARKAMVMKIVFGSSAPTH